MSDRDAEDVQTYSLLQRSFPDIDVLTLICNTIADSIEVINAQSTYAWKLQVRTKGNTEEVQLYSGTRKKLVAAGNDGPKPTLYLLLDTKTLSPDALEMLSDRKRVLDSGPDDQITKVWLSSEQIAVSLPHLLPAHHAALLQLAAYVGPPHSSNPEAIELIKRFTGRDLPVPRVRQAWKLSTKGFGQLESRFLTPGVMALDFPSVDFDLRDAAPDSVVQLRDEFLSRGIKSDYTKNHATMQLWSLFSEVSREDTVFLSYDGSIRAVGTVGGDYEFDPSSSNFQHRRPTEWERIQHPISKFSPALAARFQVSYMALEKLTPAEAVQVEQSINPPPRPKWQSTYAVLFSNAGLTYTPWQQAVFFTALQTKGFVILSGISGTGKTKIAQAFAAAMPQPADGTRNVEFLTVRPDWRDSKSLIGYHNPLTDRYEWTPFLRFLLRAYESWEERDGLAWFVILDEMNLAHVEHYFAEMLSIIESGRDDDGWSREAIAIPSNGGEGSPPSRIKLPPNLHIIGTVNLDDTTHAFSPKVLDRAFALEFSDVSFAGYLVPSPTSQPEFDPLDASELLNALSSDGSFPRVDKTALSAFLLADDRPRIWLESLNRRLRPHHLHYGYRVFDEIVAFVSYGMNNGLFAGMPPDGDPVTAAFDAAAMMKILPKFHGSRSRLDMPLKIVLGWCLNPSMPDLESIFACVAKANSPHEMEQALLGLTFHFPNTAERTIRLLWTAHVEGFAAFG